MRHFTELLTRLTIVLFFLFSLAATSGVAAQTTAGQLTTLAVELWPDYDRPAVLVLLTAELPAGTALPATVTIPLPGEADVNAVARFDDTGAMLSDVDYTTSAGQLTLTTPANRFRVEYYAPYEVAEEAYSFTFDWTADLDVAQMTVVVQQPLAATDMTITPTPTGTADRGDGLIYHTLAARPVGAGEPVTVRVAYTVEAVSYTHLDVYKRQDQQRAPVARVGQQTAGQREEDDGDDPHQPQRAQPQRLGPQVDDPAEQVESVDLAAQ